MRTVFMFEHYENGSHNLGKVHVHEMRPSRIIYFLLNSILLIFSTHSVTLDARENETHCLACSNPCSAGASLGSCSHEVLWARSQTPSIDLRVRGKDETYDLIESIKIGIEAAIREDQKSDKARINQLEQKLQQAFKRMDRMDNLVAPPIPLPTKRRWFGCTKCSSKSSRRRTFEYTRTPIIVPLSSKQSSPSSASSAVTVHVHMPPKTSHPPPSPPPPPPPPPPLPSSPPPPPPTPPPIEEPENLEDPEDPIPEELPEILEGEPPIPVMDDPPPPDVSTEKSNPHESGSDLAPPPWSTEPQLDKVEEDVPNTSAQTAVSADSSPEVANTEGETLPTSPKKPPSKKPPFRLTANFEYKKEPEKREYPIYTFRQKSSPEKKSAHPGVLKFHFSRPEEDEGKHSHPIYTTSYSAQGGRAKGGKKKEDDFGPVRNVYVRKGRTKPETKAKSDDSVRTVYLRNRGKLDESKETPAPRKDGRRIGVVADVWPTYETRAKKNVNATKSYGPSKHQYSRSSNSGKYGIRNVAKKKWWKKTQ